MKKILYFAAIIAVFSSCQKEKASLDITILELQANGDYVNANDVVVTLENDAVIYYDSRTDYYGKATINEITPGYYLVKSKKFINSAPSPGDPNVYKFAEENIKLEEGETGKLTLVLKY